MRVDKVLVMNDAFRLVIYGLSAATNAFSERKSVHQEQERSKKS